MSNRHCLTLCDSFAQAASRQGHRLALVHADDVITYRELFHTVQILAQGIRQMHKRGDRIAIIANKTTRTVTTLLATLHTSAVLVIINPQLKREQIEHILKNSGTCTLFCQPDIAKQLLISDSVPASLERVVMMPISGTNDQNAMQISACGKTIRVPIVDANCRPLDALHNMSDQQTVDPPQQVTILQWRELIQPKDFTYERSLTQLPVADDLAIILYTSGSTGKPKGVKISHSNLWHGAESVTNYLKNTAEDRILALMPLSFDYGLSQLTTAIHSGACLVLHDYVFPKAVLQIVIEQEITGIPAVPHIWDRLTCIGWPAVPSLRYLTNTGGRLQLSTINALNRQFPDAQLYSMYGFTEAFRGTYLPPEQLDNRPTSIGKAVPHATVLVVDADGRELPAGSIGEIIQSGPLVSLGYWDDIETSSIKIRPRSKQHDPSQRQYAWSGDLAYTDEDGFIYFVSRKDDQVKLNGYRASLAEIENLLLSCPWISEVAVICVADERFGHVAIAFVVLNEPTDQDALTYWARQKLPTYMVPTKWFTLDALPVTPNNKIDKESLKLRIGIV